MNSGRWQQSTGDGTSPDRTCAFVRENLAALALGALDAVDRETVEHHLRWCADCRNDATAYEAAAGMLPLLFANDVEPNPASKTLLLERIATEDEPAAARLAWATPREAAAPAHTPNASGMTRGWTRYVPAALVAPLAIALIVMGAWANSMRNELEDSDATTPALPGTTLQGDEVEMYTVERSCENCTGSGQFGLSEADNMGMVVAWDFDPTQQHEVWGVTHSGELKKVCELYVDPAGSVMQTFNLPEQPSGLTEIYITDTDGNLIYVVHIRASPVESPATATEPPTRLQ